MKPVVFAGEVPRHLMSEAAVAALNLQPVEQSPEQLSLAWFVEVLRGDLSAATALQILEAANSVLAEPWNCKSDAPPMCGPKLSDDEVTSLVTRALKHLQVFSADPASPKHWRQWFSKEFATIESLGIRAGKFGCSEDLAKLAWRPLSDGCTHYSLSDAVFAHVIELHSVNPAAADDFEFEVARTVPGYVPRRHGPWASSQPRSADLPNSREFAQRVLAVMTKAQVDSFVDCCDYDWLTANQVRYSMQLNPSSGRSSRFTKATKEYVRELFEFMVSRPNVRGNDRAVLSLLDIPAWMELAADVEALRPTYQASPFTRNGVVNSLHMSRASTLLAVARTLPAGTACVLLDDMVTAGMRELAAAPADKARDMASALIDLVSFVANRSRPNIEFLHKALLEHDYLSNPNVCPNGMAALGGEYGTKSDDEVRRQLKFLELPPEVITAYRAMFIEAGLVSIGSIRPIDQRKDIIGPALARNPERLAEVTDIERFVDLARRFSIPVELPDTVRPELRAQVAMESVMPRAADPLAATDPLARSAQPARRRMRT